jgi:S-adenosylmethionine hydrolase
VRLSEAAPRRFADGRIEGHVAHVDRFGNAITDVPGTWLPARGCELGLRQHRARQRADHYAAMAAGEPTLVIGSVGTIEISLRGESLAHAWGVESGDDVWIVAETEAEAEA